MASGGGALPAQRGANRGRVIDALRQRGAASRGELVRATGLSRATVSSLVGELLDEGVITERQGLRAPGAPRTGRPPVLLALDPRAGSVLGLDFGHSHVRVAVADLSAQVLAERHHPLDVDASADAALDCAAALVTEVLAEAGAPLHGVVGCGVGIPGPIDRRTGLVGPSPILPGWTGVAAAEEVARRLGVPVDVDNDATLGALGEATYGAARGAQDVIYVKVSSGIGAGLLLGGRLHRGSGGIAGEIGHVLYDSKGKLCRCGSRGCLETAAAAPALLALVRDTYGGDPTVAEVVAMALDGDVGTRRLICDAGRAVGRVLADLCNALNPELIVLGGDLATASAPLAEGVRDALDRYALPAAAADVEVAAGVLGERAELLGALALVTFEHNGRRPVPIVQATPITAVP